jgi:hypothetical protein
VEPLEVQREYQRRTEDQKLFGGVAIHALWRMFGLLSRGFRTVDITGAAVCLAGGGSGPPVGPKTGAIGAGPPVGAGEQFRLRELVEAGVDRAFARLGLVPRCQAKYSNS